MAYKVEYEREGCIGAGVCVAMCEKHWVMNADGKADLIASTKEGRMDVKEIGQDDLESMKQAAEGCPVNVIHILKKDTGEKVI
ncbi:MAG: ferredoxin [Candidatus Aenigmarchaeota archaeon]|nr:ferredoxin [Candidatus Aenigmarchaeota archaeon]